MARLFLFFASFVAQKGLKYGCICFIILYSRGIKRAEMRKQKNSGSITQLLAVIILIQLSWSTAWGLDPDKRIDQYLVDSWEMADGMPSNTMYYIAQTPDGYLWIGMDKDLVRFDGMKFSIIPYTEKGKDSTTKLPKTITLDTLFVDRREILWIGSSAGLTSYNYQTGRFKTFTLGNGLTGGIIRRIQDDMKGNLWISFDSNCVNRFSKEKFTVFNASNGLGGKRVNAIVEDQKGNLLFATRENGIFKYRDGQFFKYPVAGIENSFINTMWEDRKGDLWIGANNGLFRVIVSDVRRYTVKNGLSYDNITDIREDSDGNLWVGTLRGLNRIKRNKDGIITIERLMQLVLITCLFEDIEKNLWVGTEDSGLKRLKDGKFISYAPIDTYQAEIPISVFQDRYGDTWTGTLNGKLFHCRGSDVTESVVPPELSNTGIAAIAEDAGGNLWLGTNGKGVFQRKNGAFIQYTTRQGLADNMITSIYRDSRGNLWFSTFNGLSVFRYPGGVIESIGFRDGQANKRINNVYEDKNQNIWAATDQGVIVLKGGKLEKQKAEYYLEGDFVTCIYEDPSPPEGKEGVYWIATNGAGLKRLILKDKSITTYTDAAGMTTNVIYQFFEDRLGNFWLMSDSGILRVSKTDLNGFARGELDKINCISYGISDGMKSPGFHNEYSRHSALKSKNGELWFVTKKGISIINPQNIKINKNSPPVVIEAVYFDQQSVPLHQDPGTYSFKGTESLRFHFTAPTFLSPEKIKFKYRLEGFDRDWIFLPPGSGRVAHYWNLDPGTYTFRVIASNAEGVWNQTGDAFTFSLKPFFYQTLLFKIAVPLLLAVLLGAAVYIYKKRPFEKRRKKYEGSSLTDEFADVCVKKLRHLMEVEKIYRDERITLQSLSEKLLIKHYQLSQVLNEKLNQNFSDYINYYRIEETKEILRSPAGAKKKITTVAQDVGFNSMTAFYKAFKKNTGMTPNQYKKEVKKNK
jgi:ligand-binding sensor domain-containing protein/AraC-like DNA-binding protein